MPRFVTPDGKPVNWTRVRKQAKAALAEHVKEQQAAWELELDAVMARKPVAPPEHGVLTEPILMVEGDGADVVPVRWLEAGAHVSFADLQAAQDTDG